MLEYLKKLDAEGQAYDLEARFGSGRAPLKGAVLTADAVGVVLATSGGPCMVSWQSAEYFIVEMI